MGKIFISEAPYPSHGMESTFADRQKNLFASLDAAEKEHTSSSHQTRQGSSSSHSSNDTTNLQSPRVRQNQVHLKQFRGRESIFKRPEMPPPRRSRQSLPDHMRNPHRWTKYTLGDVSSQDMSDRSNTATALSFLRELRERKPLDGEGMEGDLPTSRPIFKSSHRFNDKRSSCSGTASLASASTSEEAQRSSFRSSKLIMPEYVVGQKKEKKSKPKKVIPIGKEIRLDHLMDDDE